MFLNRTPQRRVLAKLSSPQQQRGGALAVAIFIIVVMSLLGVAMVQILNELSRSTVSDVYGTRAYAAARSGAEIFLTELFPLDAPVNSTLCEIRSGLPNVEVLNNPYTIDGLNQCRSVVLCDRKELPSPFIGTHFRIVAQGICETGDMVYSKEVILEAADGVF